MSSDTQPSQGAVGSMSPKWLTLLAFTVFVGLGVMHYLDPDKMPLVWWFGASALVLYGQAAFLQIVQGLRQTQNVVSDSEVRVRCSQAAATNDIKQHAGKLAEGINEVSEATTAAVLKNVVDALPPKSCTVKESDKPFDPHGGNPPRGGKKS